MKNAYIYIYLCVSLLFEPIHKLQPKIYHNVVLNAFSCGQVVKPLSSTRGCCRSSNSGDSASQDSCARSTKVSAATCAPLPQMAQIGKDGS